MAKTFDITPEQRATQLAFLKRQLFRKPPPTTRKEFDLSGQTAIVTGSNTGIGLECNRQLLELGLSRLIMAVRSESKGEEAKADLLSSLTKTASSMQPIIEVWKLDLSVYGSITSFVDRCEKSLDRLDIVVSNAGLIKNGVEINKSTKHEETMQVNYLSTALLTILLLPVMKAKNKKPGRMVIVNSETAAWADFFDTHPSIPSPQHPVIAELDKADAFPQTQAGFAARYGTTKLLGQFFLVELTRRIPPSVAVVNVVNPGLCQSGLNRESIGTVLGFVFNLIVTLIGRSAAVGARTLTDAALRHGTDSHGQYLEDGKLQPLAPIVYKPRGATIAEAFWEETMEELSFARVAEIVASLSG